MSTIKPGRETDARIAEALGWVVVDVDYYNNRPSEPDWIKSKRLPNSYAPPLQVKYEALFDRLGIQCVGRYYIDPKRRRVYGSDNFTTGGDGARDEFRPSRSPTDAIAALEATGRMYRIEKVIDYFVDVGSPTVARGQAPTLCLAACEAILQLPSSLTPRSTHEFPPRD